MVTHDPRLVEKVDRVLDLEDGLLKGERAPTRDADKEGEVVAL